MKYFTTSVLIAVLFVVFSCQNKEKTEVSVLSAGEGYVDMGGGKLWYRVVGSGAKTPLILLHGGPGFTSYYLNPLAELGQDRPVVFYDQLGCGRSEGEVDKADMTVEAHIRQLEALRKHLNIDTFYLYGHSWGTMLGVDYYLQHPVKVEALILASPALSAEKWKADADILITLLPDTLQKVIRESEEAGVYDDPAYQEAVQVFYQNFVARKLPWDANVDSTFAGANLDIYETMWGPSEFTPTGNLKDYDRTGDLGKITVPTLFIAGEYDEARTPTVQYYQSLVDGAEFEIIEGAAHLTMHDRPEQDLQVISAFLNSLEK